MNKKITYLFLLILTSLFFSSCNTGYDIEDKKVTYTYWHEGMGFSATTFEVLDADYKSFKEISSAPAFGVDKTQAFYKGLVINNSDGKSFQPLEGGFSKDSKRVFYMYQSIRNADSKSFQVINKGPFSYDDHNIYFYWKSIGAKDINSFEVIDALGAKDNQYYYKTSIAGDSLHIGKYPIKDKNTFQLLDHRYSKDKFQVYFDGEIVQGADSKTFEVIDYAKGQDSKSLFYGKSRINSPNTFKELSDGYSIDSVSVYYKWALINEAKPSSFQIINQYWARDDSSVFLEGQKQDSINDKTFKHIQGKYAKDEKYVYHLSSIVNMANPKTVESLDYWQWIKDDKSYFFEGKRINEIDYSTFRILENDYSIDKNRVYFRLKPIDNIDVKTFKTTDGTFGGQDKNGTYYMGEKY